MRVKTLDRFNQNADSRFLNDYQKVIEEIFILQRDKKHTEVNINRAIRNKALRPSNSLNTNINKGILISMNLEAEIYYELQEQIKKVTGKYMAMDEFLHYIIIHFIYQYKYNKTYIPPFIEKKIKQKKKINKKRKIQLFYKHFRPFMN